MSRPRCARLVPALLLVALTGSACGSGASDGSGRPAAASPTSARSGVGSSALLGLFQVQPSDAVASPLGNFQYTVTLRLRDGCLRSKGITYGPPIPPYLLPHDEPSVGEVYPLDLIAKYKWARQSLGPSQPLTASQMAAYNAASNACGAIPDYFAAVNDAASALGGSFTQAVTSAQSKPEVIAQFARWSSCVKDGGVPVQRPHEFIDFIAAEQTTQSTEAYDAHVASFVPLFLSCTRPLYDVLIPALVSAREGFFTRNATQLAALQQEIDHAVTEASAAVGIDYTKLPVK